MQGFSSTQSTKAFSGGFKYSPTTLLGGICGALLAGYFRGSSLEIGDEYLLASIALVVIGGTSVSGGQANVAGLWGAALFLVLSLTMLNTFGVSAGVRLVVTGLRDHCGNHRGTISFPEVGGTAFTSFRSAYGTFVNLKK